jgi:hypothetical protein
VTGAWDRINGFLVECPSCHRNHGKRWSIRAIALASFLLNAVSFYFTMRPLRATVFLLAWVAAFWLILAQVESAPESVQLLAFGALLMGPLLINMALLVRHQIHLERQTVQVGAA